MSTLFKFKTSAVVAALAIASAPALAAASTDHLDLSSYSHGRIISGMDLGGVSVEANNYYTNDDLAVIFDSTHRGGPDPDLQGPNASGTNGSWAGGNLASSTYVGNLVIIQNAQHTSSDQSGNYVTSPNDEGGRPAGTLTFDFDHQITSFGFDLVDVEGPTEFNAPHNGYFATFYNNNSVMAQVNFGQLLDSNSPFYDPSIAFGNNSANRIAPFTAADLNLTGFDKVEIGLGGSAGVANVVTTAVPTPTAAVAGLGLLGALALRRRRRRASV